MRLFETHLTTENSDTVSWHLVLASLHCTSPPFLNTFISFATKNSSTLVR